MARSIKHYESEDTLNVDEILKQYSWLCEEELNCVISPDSDGIASALLMSHHLGWNVKGYYDGKVLLLADGVSIDDAKTVFLDIEVARPGVKSIGHHMIVNHGAAQARVDSLYEDCFNPNLVRKFNKHHHFKRKYPLGTVHLLLSVLFPQVIREIHIDKAAIAPLYFVDGVFQNLFLYPENVSDWVRWLGGTYTEPKHPLTQLFMQKEYSIYDQIEEMKNFFVKRDSFSEPGRRGDKIKLSDSKGQLVNCVNEEDSTNYRFESEFLKKVDGFIRLMSEGTGWAYNTTRWTYQNLTFQQLKKSSFQSDGKTLTQKNFDAFLQRNPFSWAITSNSNLEFTLE